MTQDFSNKAQEISYALMRVAVYIKRKDLRSRFECLALEIVESVAGDNKEFSLLAMAKVLEVLKLAASIYEVETINAKMIIEQVEAFVASMRQVHYLGGLPDIGNIFSKPLEFGNQQKDIRQLFNDSAKVDLPHFDIPAKPIPKAQEAFEALEADAADTKVAIQDIQEQENVGMVSIASTIRQTAILTKVRMMTVKNEDGSLLGCRMKDLMAAFPDVSERTLRNDLQRLVAQSKVTRIGNGGPASFYVIK